MTNPLYSSTGLPTSALVDSWSNPDMYLDPLETDMEGGNKRLRSRPGDNVQRLQFEILFTYAQLATFKTFVLTTLGNGTSRFDMSVWTGAAYETKTVQFASKPTLTNVPPKVRMKFDLWIMGTP